MKIYDISQELFHSNIYPGDEYPTFERTMKIADGEVCNLTVLKMCAHNGTHVDAPYHFYDDGKTIDCLDLSRVIGKCTVVSCQGELTSSDVDEIMKTAQPRVLLKGDVVVTLEAAKQFNQYHVLLIGNESQTVGPLYAPKPIHLELLKEEVVLLEGVVLTHVPDGDYLLNAAPINLGGADGAPCRAVLIQED
ncbi:MAG: cyclase family protein [Clostridiales bacterium]|nr:cyclase family protein [Clostridiales bacterium]